MDKRDDALDVIRALAAIGVVIFHLPSVAQVQFTLPFDPKVYNLANGVPLFFVLSGYLLTVLMQKNDRHYAPVTAFYIKRFFRIAPLFYAVIAITIFRNMTLGREFPATSALIANVSLLFNLTPYYADSLVFAGWTIGVEILFYLLFPIIYLMTRSMTGLIITFTASVLLCEAFVALMHIYRDQPWLRYSLLGLPRRLPIFLLGVAIARFLPLASASRHSKVIGFCVIAATIVAGAVLVKSQMGAFVGRHWRELAAGALMFGLVLCLPARGLGPLAFVGRVSYSTYLIHGLVMLSMTPVYAWIIALGLGPGPTILIGLGATFVVALPLSYLTYLLIEQPGIKLGTRLIERIDQRRAYRAPVAADPALQPAK